MREKADYKETGVSVGRSVWRVRMVLPFYMRFEFSQKRQKQQI